MKKLLTTLALLVGFVALNPANSFATGVKCPPGKCYSASWGGCISCRYIKNDKKIKKQMVILTGVETKLTKQYKATLIRLKKIAASLRNVKARKARLMRLRASRIRALKRMKKRNKMKSLKKMNKSKLAPKSSK